MKKIIGSLVFILFGLFALTTQALATSNLVGWWRLEGNAIDSSTYLNNGSVDGGVTFVPGKYGQAANFDGLTGYISVPDSASLDITGNITVDGWVKPISYAQQITVAGKWNDLSGNNNRGYLLAVHTDGTPRFYISTNGIDYPAAIGPTLTLNDWHHLVGSYDGSDIKLYVDGVLFTTPQSGSIHVNNEPLLIGANDGFGGSNRKFSNAVIDEVKVINSVVLPHTCTETGFYRDDINLTAAQIGGDVNGIVDATGCNIGVYYGPNTTATVNGGEVFGSNYYGIVAHHAAVNINNSYIHDIGENPLNGSQHGVGVYFANVVTETPAPKTQPACDDSGTTTGEIKNNTIERYQKGGIVINCTGAQADIVGNTVTGVGPVDWIAQNGIQVSRLATGQIYDNVVTGNYYTGDYWSSAGLLLYDVHPNLVRRWHNTLDGNQAGQLVGNANAAWLK